MTRLERYLLPILIAFSISILPITAQGQIYDPNANFVTIVGGLTSNLPGTSSASAQNKQSSTTTKFTGTPYIVGPTITPTTTEPEAEEHIAVSPASSSTLAAAISDFSRTVPPPPAGVLGFNTTKYAVSSDNGSSWQESFVPETAGQPATSDGQIWLANSDPVVAIDTSGRVYLASLYLINETGTGEGFYVCLGNLPSVTFTVQSCVPVATNLAGTNIEDKEWITVGVLPRMPATSTPRGPTSRAA